MEPLSAPHRRRLADSLHMISFAASFVKHFLQKSGTFFGGSGHRQLSAFCEHAPPRFAAAKNRSLPQIWKDLQEESGAELADYQGINHSRLQQLADSRPFVGSMQMGVMR